MNASEAYVSAIPSAAEPREVFGCGSNCRVFEYHFVGEMVGRRVIDLNGAMLSECSFRNGKRHGWEFTWDDDGYLISAAPFEDGLEHGTALQFGPDGSQIGSYNMNHGTGTDLWWSWITNETTGVTGNIELSEARQITSGEWDGFEYWFASGSPGVLMWERWWSNGKLHGIERYWNPVNRMRRGYPKYWIQGVQVDRRKYVAAAKRDASLRPFLPEDIMPFRHFPDEIERHFNR